MKGIFSPVDNVREPPVPPTGEDVREPPLPSNNDSKDDLPGDEEKIDREGGGGRAPRRLGGGDCGAASDAPPDEIPENERTSHEPRS
jgi:hypothetical protein